ncbi:MAG: cytochrome c-type biogenesis protein CcmH [Gemmatimonadota bacterium]
MWSQRFLELLEQGESEEAILAGFATEFGPSVRMVPPLEGFSWVGYFLPWVAILAMTAIVGTILRRWVPQTDMIRVRNELSPEEWERIRMELDRMVEEEGEFEF